MICLNVNEVEVMVDGEIAAIVKCFDDACVDVQLRHTCHNRKSWLEVSHAIMQAIDMIFRDAT